MTHGSEIRAEPAHLIAGAEVCRGLQNAIGQGLAELESPTWAAHRSLAGWLTQRAVYELFWGWVGDLATLGARLAATGEALDLCAHEYQYADHASAHHFTEAAGQW